VGGGGGGGLQLPTVNSFEGSSTSLPEATLTLIFVVELLEVEGWGSTNFRPKKNPNAFLWQHLCFPFCEIRGSKQGEYLGYAKNESSFAAWAVFT
jgi:hypothetical protein